jgi:hypothetical protein
LAPPWVFCSVQLFCQLLFMCKWYWCSHGVLLRVIFCFACCLHWRTHWSTHGVLLRCVHRVVCLLAHGKHLSVSDWYLYQHDPWRVGLLRGYV